MSIDLCDSSAHQRPVAIASHVTRVSSSAVTTPSQGNEMRVVAAMLSCATLAEVSLAGLSLNLA